MLVTRHHQFRRHVAIAVGHAQRRFIKAVASEGGIGVVVDAHGIIYLMRLFWTDARTIVVNTWRLAFVHSQHQCGLGGVYKHVLGIGNLAQRQGKAE